MIEEQVLTTAIEYLYMTDQTKIRELPKHLIWQSPLLIPDDINDFTELNQRIKHAGGLWIQNHDLSENNLLVITHKTAWISYLFQRSQSPQQRSIALGPISRRLLNNGTHLPPYPLIFQEFIETVDTSSNQDIVNNFLTLSQPQKLQMSEIAASIILANSCNCC